MIKVALIKGLNTAESNFSHRIWRYHYFDFTTPVIKYVCPVHYFQYLFHSLLFTDEFVQFNFKCGYKGGDFSTTLKNLYVCQLRNYEDLYIILVLHTFLLFIIKFFNNAIKI